MVLNEFMQDYVNIVSKMAWLLVLSGIFFIILFSLMFFLLKLWIRQVTKNCLPELRKTDDKGRKLVTVGFFHPYCNAGGGGERVLWAAIKAVMKRYPHVRCVVYTGDTDAEPSEILNRANQRFNINLPKGITFVYLKKREMVEANRYPYFTLLGQSLGSVVLGWEAMLSFVPDVYIDTMGYAFTLPLFRFLGGCRVGCYVHYPTISTDMLEKVTQRKESYNNAGFISKSMVLSHTKLLYYKLFAYLYGVAGKRSDVIMVNSTWTYNHIKYLWQADYKTGIVYPPCDVSEFLTISPQAKSSSSCLNIISVGQFRPEKDHPLQIRSFGKFVQNLSSNDRNQYKLLLVGSCRNQDDTDRVQNLKELAEEMGVQDNVEFHLNVSFTELKRLLSTSTIGLHSMWNEHFGIGVVECMAAATIVLAHDSGGPKLDIVTKYADKITGFLADNEQSFADRMKEIFKLSDEDKNEIIRNARISVKRFSDEEFEKNFIDSIEPLLNFEGVSE
ncbi:hypothetical protein SNE40_016681 [Patella caerulea]|uniref:GDP-Man:Man(3)GlcNAc(2)-PP-Dol alpha-1,2-mannosyltransferase n=1 Tax=Patella caerulea TaxID=87958 RepID=A0AAN8J904_PATCE